MGKCCGNKNVELRSCDPCSPPGCACLSAPQQPIEEGPLAWFSEMIDHCYDYAVRMKEEKHPIVGIMCEFTPRELIMAAGGVPICLCGGDAGTIPSAEEDLPANLCPLIKSTYGYHVEGSNPFLEMADLLVAETTCDGKKKMYELMAETRPMHILELPQKPDDEDAFQHWYHELCKLRSELERRFGTKITDDKLRAAVETMNNERTLRRELAGLMKAENPPITGRQLLDLKSSISGIPADLDQYRAAIEALNGKASTGSPVRVLLTGVPLVHGAERVIEIIESRGGLVVCMENCTGVKPIIEDVDLSDPDPMHAIAMKYFHLNCSVMTKNDRRLELIKKLAEEYRAECIIDLVWQACLTYDIESARIRRVAEDIRLPFLRIGTDYSPSDSARIAVRVEALFETVSGGVRRKRCPTS